MNKIEKLKVAVDVALYYFTINTVFYFLIFILPYLRSELTLGLRAYAIPFVPLIVAIIFLVILLNVLKRKVQGRINAYSKTSIFIIVGVLLIITAVIRIPSYVSLIGVLLEHSSLKDGIYITVVPIAISVVQISTGAYLTLISIKRDKQIEKIKVAVDVALYYFTIISVIYLMSRIFSDLLFRGSRQLSEGLRSNIIYYVVIVVVILLLALISNILKRKAQGDINVDNKPLIFIIVGVLLIITAITEIPTQMSWVYSYYSYSIDKGISQDQKTQFTNYIYWAIVQMVFFAIQIGIGSYLTLMTKKRDSQIEETR
jgi:membrane protease YdiL (CAAX protease family)